MVNVTGVVPELVDRLFSPQETRNSNDETHRTMKNERVLSMGALLPGLLPGSLPLFLESP